MTVLDSLLSGRTKLAGRPYAAAISSLNVAYVAQLDLSRVARANLPSQAFTATVTVGSTPTEIAFNSAGTRAYVTNQFSSTLSVVDVTTNMAIDAVGGGSRPFEVIVAPGDSILYVAKTDSVYGIRLSNKTIIVRFPIPGVGNGVAIANDTLLYVSTHGGGTVVEFNLRTRAVARTFALYVIDPVARTLVSSNIIGGSTRKIVFTADGSIGLVG